MTSYDTIPPKPLKGIISLALAAGLTLSGIKYSIDRSNGYVNGEDKITFGETPRSTAGLEGKLDDKSTQTTEPYASFKARYPNEIDDVLVQSDRYDIDPVLLMAVRCAENGRDALAYGIKPQRGKQMKRYEADKGYSLDGKFHPYPSGDEGKKMKQLCWAAKSIHDRVEEHKELKSNIDIIDYMQPIWAPGAGRATNDPKGRNAHWEDNVRHWYEILDAERPKE